MKDIIEIYVNKKTFRDLEHVEKIVKKWGYNPRFRNKKGLITDEEYIFKQKDKSRYYNKEKHYINENLSILIGVKIKKIKK
tara:strand:- start:134 stop:376 length:243 start_codon:yes stop_codon:yes gene_type:complete